MPANKWQRLADAIRADEEFGYFAELRLMARIVDRLAAEDAECEQRGSRCDRCGCPSSAHDPDDGVCMGGMPDSPCVCYRPGPVPSPGHDAAPVAAASVASLCQPVQGLPPLDPGLVEECLSIYESVDALAVPSMRAALNHYRERVERPLREALAGWMQHVQNAFDEEVKACAEANRLRAELNQYDERGHDAQIEIDRLRGELAAARDGGFIK